MARQEEKLALGKGAAFVKSRLKRLPLETETWEADFRALPKPMTQSLTDYLGMVVDEDGALLAISVVRGRPSVNDLATILAHAMRRPLAGAAHLPHRLSVRGHPQWRELFPHLAEIGIETSALSELSGIEEAYDAHLRHLMEDRRVGLAEPSAEQRGVEKLFPAIARWVDGYGHIEIGDQEGFGFIVRALDYGGLVF